MLFSHSYAVFGYPFNDHKPHAQSAENATFDYVVVGGGTAEQRYKVAVEASGSNEYMHPLARIQASSSFGVGADGQATTPIDWNFVIHGVPGANFCDFHSPRGKCLGGSSSTDLVLTATREIILSVGAFQSSQLLIVSGIGPAQVLSTYGINVIVDLPGVGQNMWDHVFFDPSYQEDVPTLVMLKKRFEPSSQSAADKLSPESRSALSETTEDDLSFIPSDWPEREQPPAEQCASIAAVLVAPTSRGNVTIRSTDTADAPVINPNWLGTETDQQVAVAAYRRARGFFRSGEIASVIIGECFPGSDDQTDAAI
ncbi:Glucose-methanol-choline oxidoreductase [Penicillium coprophilum]|uniref:Glucose-methanol-choline oxidoreductase n=1 Tax=Penicillium coprophilum TaxID=36646 RepID=UPI002398CEC0|nr:Glucose-methanol-choline oxidoreductase [Penicillium coprophilum]KAJ5153584.1 Glucose-methanol-choline oxidoreductase [Penicillium coprophilum]